MGDIISESNFKAFKLGDAQASKERRRAQTEESWISKAFLASFLLLQKAPLLSPLALPRNLLPGCYLLHAAISKKGLSRVLVAAWWPIYVSLQQINAVWLNSVNPLLVWSNIHIALRIRDIEVRFLLGKVGWKKCTTHSGCSI